LVAIFQCWYFAEKFTVPIQLPISTISYSTRTPTNQNVIATITFSEPVIFTSGGAYLTETESRTTESLELLNKAVDEWQAQITEKIYEKEQQGQQAQQDYATQQASIMAVYEGGKSLVVDDALKGTEYDGKTLEELARLYNQMNTDQREIFRTAMDAFTEFNAGVDYLTDNEKTMAEAIWKIAAASSSGAGPGEVDVRSAISTLQARNMRDEKKNDTAYTTALKANESAYANAQNDEERNRILTERQAIYDAQYKAIEATDKAVKEIVMFHTLNDFDNLCLL